MSELSCSITTGKVHISIECPTSPIVETFLANSKVAKFPPIPQVNKVLSETGRCLIVPCACRLCSLLFGG